MEHWQLILFQIISGSTTNAMNTTTSIISTNNKKRFLN